MLKGFGKLAKKGSTATLSAGSFDEPPRSTTPTPSNPSGKPTSCTGLLTIRVLWAEGLALPVGSTVPSAVQAALSTQQAKAAASVSPSSVTQRRLAKRHGPKDSLQRTQCWWLPYLVMEFEVNQVLITPLGGDLQKPLYMYQAQLRVFISYLIFLLLSSSSVTSLATPKSQSSATCEPNSPKSVVMVWQMIWATIFLWEE